MPDALSVGAILVMALVAYAMRAGGFWLMARVPMTPRVRCMLAALPGSIVAATVLPIVFRNGPPAALAMAAVAAVMILERNQFLAIAIGVAVAAVARGAGL
jgi:uncharacterized membrane protein